MLQVIPTYVVTFADEGRDTTLEVSRTDLEALLRVLIFNGHTQFSVYPRQEVYPC